MEPGNKMTEKELASPSLDSNIHMMGLATNRKRKFSGPKTAERYHMKQLLCKDRMDVKTSASY